MDRDKIEEEHSVSLYRFAWALSGDRTHALDLTRRVFGDDRWHAQAAGGSRATEVALFTAAFRDFAGGKPIPAPPVHDRVASIDPLSLQQASSLSAEALLHSFSGLELPQRAALVLFYTTQCSIHDISVVLHQTHEVTVAIISRAKAEWQHILQRDARTRTNDTRGAEMKREEAQLRLSVYRQSGVDRHDPFFTEAVNQAAAEPALARWWAEQQALDAILAKRLRELSPPAPRQS